MKKFSYVFMVGLAVYALQACNNSPKGANQNTGGLNPSNKAAARSGNPINTTADARIMPMKVDSGDARFATAAAGGNLAETAIAVVALQKTKSEKIKAFANMMITGHGKINDELTAIAKTKNIILPTSVSNDVQKKMDELSNKSGTTFDKAYIVAMVTGHQKALKMYRDAAKNCADTDLKSFAAKTAAVVQMHLDAIDKISAGTN